METIIEQQVYLEPKYLNPNLEIHLLEKLRSCIVGMCDSENGYILSVDKIINASDNKISQTSSCIFTVKYLATTLKPEIGKRLFGKICMLFRNGIFVDIHGKMKVLIPSSTFEDFTFDNDVFKIGNLVIKEGDEITTEITMFKYDKKNFNCIGKLIL
jgi:DNA-directed RNA polymerase subunit E'/Rpb7